MEGKLFNLNAEAEILGGILIKNDALCEVIDFLKPGDFYRDSHKIIYKTMSDMYRENLPIDVVMLCEKLGSKLSEVGGLTYLSQLLGGALNIASIRHYAEIVKDKSNIRRLLNVLKRGVDGLYNKDEDFKNIANRVENEIFKIRDGSVYDDGDINIGLGNYLNTLEERYKKGGSIQGIGSGYKSIDRTLGGLNKQDFLIIAARPSMGKTAFALNIALNASIKGGAKVAFLNLEMGKTQIFDRAVSILSGIPAVNIKNGTFSENDWIKITEASSLLSMSKMKIYDKIFSLNTIKAECKKLKIKQGLDVVIIDYLQLIEGDEKSENRTQDVSKISRGLKLMAKELDITVIALSQLSRAPEIRLEHRPFLSDLRESGSIEQDADAVMFLYRDEYYNIDTKDKNIIECIIAKNRNGEVGIIKLKWIPEYQKVL